VKDERVADVVRVGLLYPGFAAEDDYPVIAERVRPVVDFRLVHTTVGEDAHRLDALLDLGSSERLAAAAKELDGTGVAAVMWACTSGSFVFGWEGARRQVEELQDQLGVPVSSTSFAFVAAAAHLGVGNVAVAATYPEDVATQLVEFLGAAGLSTVRLGSSGIVTAVEVGTLGRDEVVDLVRAYDHVDADAVLVPDTALHTARWLDDLEEAAGKPVFTANQVTMWEALRLAGHPTQGEELGRLFRT
jgi:maleate cis-trans isomerase